MSLSMLINKTEAIKIGEALPNVLTKDEREYIIKELSKENINSMLEYVITLYAKHNIKLPLFLLQTFETDAEFKRNLLHFTLGLLGKEAYQGEYMTLKEVAIMFEVSYKTMRMFSKAVGITLHKLKKRRLGYKRTEVEKIYQKYIKSNMSFVGWGRYLKRKEQYGKNN